MTGALYRVLLFVLPLGLDTFAVSAAVGSNPLTSRNRWRVSAIFVIFEGGMPLAGLILGASAAHAVGLAASHFSGALLILLGGYLSLTGDNDQDKASRLINARHFALIGLALSISFDELAISFSFGLDQGAFAPAGLVAAIAIQALIASQLGLALGARTGQWIRESADCLVGPLLIVLGGYLLAGTLIQLGLITARGAIVVGALALPVLARIVYRRITKRLRAVRDLDTYSVALPQSSSAIAVAPAHRHLGQADDVVPQVIKEYVRLALNPRPDPYGPDRTLAIRLQHEGTTEPVLRALARMNTMPWAIYRVRRHHSTPAKMIRSVDKVLLGDRRLIEGALEELGEQVGIDLTSSAEVMGPTTDEADLSTNGPLWVYTGRLWLGTRRLWLRTRTIGTYPAIEEFYVAAPVQVVDTATHTFDKTWAKHSNTMLSRLEDHAEAVIAVRRKTLALIQSNARARSRRQITPARPPQGSDNPMPAGVGAHGPRFAAPGRNAWFEDQR